jgi:nucleoside-diphosphate-sugar epimerase
MKVLITGGAGFLGQRLARRLLEQGTLAAGGDNAVLPIDELVLIDRVAPESFDPRVTTIGGDIGDAALMRDAVAGADVIFHLAAIVSGQAEEDFDLGMRVNLDALRLLLDLCRAAGHCPRLVQTSSVAVYGGELPAIVTDDTPLRPASSYGMQKAVGEMLVGDYSRRNYVDGRILRLPTISVRPGKPNRAASSFASGLIREPLSGQDTICPVALNTKLWLLSPRGAIEGIVAGAELSKGALGDRRAINLPGVSVTVGEMIAALEAVGGPQATAHITYERDPAVEAIVGSWPAAWDSRRALELGFHGDADFTAIVRAHVEDELGGIVPPAKAGAGE